MGFSFTLLVCNPYVERVYDDEQTAYKSCVRWHIEQFIEFRRINHHLESLTNPHRNRYSRFDSSTRASAAVISWWYPKFLERIRRLGRRGAFDDLFAPECVTVLPFYTREHPLWRIDTSKWEYDQLEGGEVFLVQRIVGDRTCVPSLSDLHEHNEYLRMDPTKMKEFAIRDYHMVLRRGPLMWVPCRALAQWLFEMEKKKPDCYKELAKDSAALARMRVWRAQLQALGNMHARAILYFDDVYVY